MSSTVDLAFTLALWCDVIAVAMCAAIIVMLRRQRSAALKGSAGASFFVILPIYEPIVWLLAASFLIQALLLSVPGPYPRVPAWYLGATYTSAQDTASQWQAAGLYFCYWFTFELMAEGFGIMLLHK